MAIAEHSKMEFEEACYKQHIFLNHTFDLISDDISSLLSDRMSTKMKLKIDSTNLGLQSKITAELNLPVNKRT